jgi:hypothetical protein
VAVRIGLLHLQHDVQLLALRLDQGEIVEVEHAEGEPAGEHRGRRVGAERDLLHVVDLHARAGRQHRAQRDRARAAHGVDADPLADDVLAVGLGRVDGGGAPVGVGQP